jgi:hypothetical protein
MPIKFDTLEYTRHLINAGIPATQAEAQARALSEAMVEIVSSSELLLLKTDIIARIEMLRTHMDAKIDALRAEMNALQGRFLPLYLMVGLSLALHGITLVKLFS